MFLRQPTPKKAHRVTLGLFSRFLFRERSSFSCPLHAGLYQPPPMLFLYPFDQGLLVLQSELSFLSLATQELHLFSPPLQAHRFLFYLCQ